MISAISMGNKIGISDSMNDLIDRNAVNSGFFTQLISKFKVSIEYFVSSNRLITFLPQVLLIFSGLFMWNKNKTMFGLSLCGLASLGIAFLFLSPPGFIYVYPYVFIFSVLVLSALLNAIESNKLMNKVISGLIIIIVVLNVAGYIALTKKTLYTGISTKMKEISSLIPDNSIIISEPPFWFLSPEKNFKTVRYFKDRKISLKDKELYIVNCDKFTADFAADSNSLAFLDNNSDHRIVDTLLIKNSSVYGNIYLIKHSVNSLK
jgi:hypothetical protein